MYHMCTEFGLTLNVKMIKGYNYFWCDVSPIKLEKSCVNCCHGSGKDLCIYKNYITRFYSLTKAQIKRLYSYCRYKMKERLKMSIYTFFVCALNLF